MTSNEKVEKDDRFNKISTDPKFKEIPKKVRKLEIKDERFTSMFTSKSFNEGLEFDEYGRKVKNNKKTNTELEKYYSLEQDRNKETDKVEYESEDDSREEAPDTLPENVEMDYESDTSEEFDEFLAERSNVVAEDPFDEIEEKNIPTGEETKRLSVMNIDWETVHASDLYVLFSSFCKGKSKVEKVETYPSEFGIKEMDREQREGPSKEIYEVEETKKNKSKRKQSKDSNEDLNESKDSLEDRDIIHNLEDGLEEDQDNGQGVNPLKLRKYELRKLKYYYAIVYCNTVEAASQLYQECDGMEIERTQNFMDLRFVPDSLSSFPYSPKDVCENLPGNYNPKFRANSALQHSQVKLTWEASDPKRNDLIAKAFSKEQFSQEEIQQLLMSSDSESDEDAKMFADEFLGNKSDEEENLGLLKKKQKRGVDVKEGETIEISFNKGFEGVNENISINKTGTKDKSVWENYLDKKKNIRREKKTEERKKREDKIVKRKAIENATTANKKELNLLIDNSIKNKSFKYNAGDDRFSAVKLDTKFAVDPTSKEFKTKKR